MKVLIVRTDGTEEVHYVEAWNEIHALTKAETFDTVNLRDGRVMLVDDNGWEYEVVRQTDNHWKHVPTRARKPINEKATRLYQAVCSPGTTHQIAGDVAIVVDREVEE